MMTDGFPAGTTEGPQSALARIRGGLIVSCQARGEDPLRDSHVISAIARSAVQGGAVAVRLEGLSDIRTVSAVIDVPAIGLWKVDIGDSEVYITPTVHHAQEVAAAGAAVVALDGTARTRPDGSHLRDSIEAVHDAGRLVMADVSTIAEGVRAAELGADVVSTTLSGYTRTSPQVEAPDLSLVGHLAERLDIPVVAEGRYRTPAQASEALTLGAWAVVVGTAITAPRWITSQFVQQLGRTPDPTHGTVTTR